MCKEEKYEKLTKLFFKRMVILERDLNKFQNELEANTNNKGIKIFLEMDDIIPLLDMAEIMNKSDEQNGNNLYNDLTNITNKIDNDNLDDEINEFFKKYMEEGW